jgi:D-amino-acid dehydrogenase
MKIAVLGAGVTGICTAYELTKDGHAVNVYDKNSAAAQGSSFANAGLINSALALPRSMPPWQSGIFSAFSPDQDKIQVALRTNLQQIKWLWAWRNAHKHPNFLSKCQDLRALLDYSQARMQQIAAEAGLEFEHQPGQLLICREPAELARAQAHIVWLKEIGSVVRAVSGGEARSIEPSLPLDIKLAGAWHFPDDETVNSRQFALLLKNESMRLGAQFHFNAEVSRLMHGDSPEVIFKNDVPSKTFDAVVVCTGGLSRTLRTSIGHPLPVEDLYGYALTAIIKEPLNAPRGALIDTKSGSVVARIGNRVRVSSGVSLGDSPDHQNATVIKNLYQTLQTFFPSAVSLSSSAQVWKGSSFTTSDGLPHLGLSAANGIWLNIGHGANGWGLACGCARVLADLMKSRNPAVKFESMLPTRKLK